MSQPRFEYKFVSVQLRVGFMGHLKGQASPEYRQTISEHAVEGWRFVQAFAPAVGVYGSSGVVDLIFERQLD